MIAEAGWNSGEASARAVMMDDGESLQPATASGLACSGRHSTSPSSEIAIHTVPSGDRLMVFVRSDALATGDFDHLRADAG